MREHRESADGSLSCIAPTGPGKDGRQGHEKERRGM